MGRARRLLVVAAALAIFAPGLGAVTISGRVTRCCGTQPAAGKPVVVYEQQQIIAFIRGRCLPMIEFHPPEEVGSTVTLADGTYTPRGRE